MQKKNREIWNIWNAFFVISWGNDGCDHCRKKITSAADVGYVHVFFSAIHETALPVWINKDWFYCLSKCKWIGI